MTSDKAVRLPSLLLSSQPAKINFPARLWHVLWRQRYIRRQHQDRVRLQPKPLLGLDTLGTLQWDTTAAIKQDKIAAKIAFCLVGALS